MSRADYAVRLRGRNFHLADGDTIGCFAFVVTVFVCAQGPEQASTHAMQALADDDDLCAAVRNPTDDPPLVFTLETKRLDPALAPPPKRTAFEFTPDDGTEPEPGLPNEAPTGSPPSSV